MIELLCEVLSICHKISTKSNADVFFNYSPHCDNYDVFLWRDGWNVDEDFEWLAMGMKITEENIAMTIQRLYHFAWEKGVAL